MWTVITYVYSYLLLILWRLTVHFTSVSFTPRSSSFATDSLLSLSGDELYLVQCITFAKGNTGLGDVQF